MTAENDVLEFVETSLFMAIDNVGPNVYSYDIDFITPDLLPCLMVKITGTENTEASTRQLIYKFIEVTITVITGRNNEFYNIDTLYNIREEISQTLDAGIKPSTVVDMTETSASGLETDTSTESDILRQEVTFNFLTRETEA